MGEAIPPDSVFLTFSVLKQLTEVHTFPVPKPFHLHLEDSSRLGPHGDSFFLVTLAVGTHFLPP